MVNDGGKKIIAVLLFQKFLLVVYAPLHLFPIRQMSPNKLRIAHARLSVASE